MKQLIDIINEKLVLSKRKIKHKIEEYFYHEALEDGYTIKFKKTKNTVKYSIDNCNTWKNLKRYALTPEINKGQRIYFKGENMELSYGSRDGYNGIGIFESNKKFNAGGNIMSLIYGDDFLGQTKLLIDKQFNNLFNENKYIISAKDLILPATELTSHCYSGMFDGCSSLKEAPELPAIELTEECYRDMFKECRSLTKTPELPATKLADGCYTWMFCSCVSLIEATELPATELVEGCYSNMFAGCESLLKAPELPATKLAKSCYYYMFSNCESILKAPKLPATTLDKWCYNGMFSGCYSLNKSPELPATKLAYGCYNSMFGDCKSLNEITMLATDISDYDYLNSLCDFARNVPDTGTFIKVKGVDIQIASANNYYRGIPEGWAVKEI